MLSSSVALGGSRGSDANPNVISGHLLCESVEDDDAEALKAMHSEMMLQVAKNISISYREIMKIENLEILKNLRKLSLDNNNITKIEGIDKLVHLTWLDLSFNRISEISGLETLVELTDISLFNNDIVSIRTGFDHNLKLQCVSLGNNKIESLEEISHFQRLPKLEVLSLQGNPIALKAKERYKNHCLAFLPKLKYLDYCLVAPSEVATAREVGVSPDVLIASEQKEESRRAEVEAATVLARSIAANTEAIIEAPDALFSDLTEEDADLIKLRSMPGLSEAIGEWREIMTSAASELYALGANVHDNIAKETLDITGVLEGALAQQTTLLRSTISKWESRLSTYIVATRCEGTTSFGPLPTITDIQTLLEEATDIKRQAVLNEVRNFSAIRTVIELYESAIMELRARKLQAQETFFRSSEGAEGAFHAKVVALGEALLESVKAGTVTIDPDDDLSTLAHDKEALMGAIIASHDYRLGRLGKKESDWRTREVQRCDGLIQKINQEQKDKNRERLEEIATWLSISSQRLDALTDDIS